MTDLEIMQHAKEYLDKLARGIDPLTGREVPEGEIINNVRISRCLFYVSDVLRQVIENGGIQVKSVKSSAKAPFALSFEGRARYPFGDWPATVSVIAQRLNELVDLSTMQKLKTTSITAFLMQSGLLFEEESPNGSKNKRPTEAGKSLGITTTVMGRMENTPQSSTARKPSSLSWIISTPSWPSMPHPSTRIRASPGRTRRTHGCIRLSRPGRMSRKCPSRSNARVLKSAPGWKNWALDGKSSK